MSKVKDNLITPGLSGKLGKQIVFRHWCGATFLSKAPIKNHSLLKKEMYNKNRLRFREANAYGKKVIYDPDMKEAYQSKCNIRQNAFTRAVQDFLNAPIIHEIDLSGYSGEKSGFIRINATDDFRVKEVRIRIEDRQSDSIESGFADREGDTDWWRFDTTVENQFPEGCKVIVSAYDLPGNESVKEVAI